MKKVIIILGSVGVLLLVLLMLLVPSSKKQQNMPPIAPTPTPVLGPEQANQVNYHTLFTDNTVANGMSQKLSQPYTATQSAGFTVFSYKTDVPQRDNQLYLQGDTAKYFVEEITTSNTAYTDFLAKTPGAQPQVLYDPVQINVGFDWYVFPDEGIAFLADKLTGYTMKILYFPPTTYQDFLQTTAKTFSLSTTDPSANENEGQEVQGYQP